MQAWLEAFIPIMGFGLGIALFLLFFRLVSSFLIHHIENDEFNRAYQEQSEVVSKVLKRWLDDVAPIEKPKNDDSEDSLFLTEDGEVLEVIHEEKGIES